MADPTYIKFSELTELEEHPARTDYFPFVDASATATKRVTLANIDPLQFLELADPGGDFIPFWDDSEGVMDWLTPGDGLTITGGTLDMDLLGIEDLTDPDADRIMFWDDSAGILTWLSLGANLEISGTSLVVNMETDTITGSEIADDSIDSNHYVDGSIDLAHMSANSIDSDQYVDGSIDRAHLSADIIDGTKIANDSIDSEHYVAGSIDAEHIATGAVTNTKIGADAIDDTKIADDSIGSEHIQTGAVGAAELANDAVGTLKIQAGAVGTARLDDEAVTPAKTSFLSGVAAASELYFGTVTSLGVGTYLPSGWSSTKLSTGKYKITHSLNTSSYGLVAVGNGVYFVIHEGATNYVELWTYNADQNLNDSDIHFILFVYA